MLSRFCTCAALSTAKENSSVAVDSAAQVQNLLSMTPHFWRIAKEGATRLAATESLTDTAQVIFNLYRKEDSHAG